MYPTRSSARIQSEKDAELNNQLLSFFNDFFKITLKLSVLNEELFNNENNKPDILGTNTVDIKEKDLDNLMSSREKKTFLKIMNDIYTNLKTMCYSSIEEKIRKEEDMKRKKIEEKLIKKIDTLKNEIIKLRQEVLAENKDKSIDTSQFKKELVQLSLLYKDDKNTKDYTEIFNNVRYHHSFINEIYLNSKEKLKQDLGNNRMSISIIMENLDKEFELIHNIMDNFVKNIEICQDKIKVLENSLNKDSLTKNKNNPYSSNVDIEIGNIPYVSAFRINEELNKINNYINENKENIDSIPIIQKYTYKNEQDINSVKTILNEIPKSNTNPQSISSVNETGLISTDTSSFNNNLYNNKRQKINSENQYIGNMNRNEYNNFSPDNLVPISSDQRTLNANSMFGNRNHTNRLPTYNNNFGISDTNPNTLVPNNANLTDITNNIRELDERVGYNMRTVHNLINEMKNEIINDSINTITNKFTEFNTQLNKIQISTNKSLTDEVENRLKNFQNDVNKANLNYINEQLKTYKKSTIDNMDQSLKIINHQVNIWKKKMTENLESQFGNTIQELKLQILSLSKLPIPMNSNEYLNLLDFLKDVFRWNWEKWKIEWAKEFYQCVQCLQKDYIKPLEDKVERLEKLIPVS